MSPVGRRTSSSHVAGLKLLRRPPVAPTRRAIMRRKRDHETSPLTHKCTTKQICRSSPTIISRRIRASCRVLQPGIARRFLSSRISVLFSFSPHLRQAVCPPTCIGVIYNFAHCLDGMATHELCRGAPQPTPRISPRAAYPADPMSGADLLPKRIVTTKTWQVSCRIRICRRRADCLTHLQVAPNIACIFRTSHVVLTSVWRIAYIYNPRG